MYGKTAILFVTLTLLASMAGAQAVALQKDLSPNDSSNTITGCLQRDDEGNVKFKLLSEEGGVWEVSSDGLDLASSVGHTVKVTGHVDPAGASPDEGAAKPQESGKAVRKRQLSATSLVKVSDGCQNDLPVR